MIKNLRKFLIMFDTRAHPSQRQHSWEHQDVTLLSDAEYLLHKRTMSSRPSQFICQLRKCCQTTSIPCTTRGLGTDNMQFICKLLLRPFFSQPRFHEPSSQVAQSTTKHTLARGFCQINTASVLRGLTSLKGKILCDSTLKKGRHPFKRKSKISSN